MILDLFWGAVLVFVLFCLVARLDLFGGGGANSRAEATGSRRSGFGGVFFLGGWIQRGPFNSPPCVGIFLFFFVCVFVVCFVFGLFGSVHV